MTPLIATVDQDREGEIALQLHRSFRGRYQPISFVLREEVDILPASAAAFFEV